MVYTKKLFFEITTLEPIETSKVYLVLSKNFQQSFIKIFEINDEPKFRSVK